MDNYITCAARKSGTKRSHVQSLCGHRSGLCEQHMLVRAHAPMLMSAPCNTHGNPLLPYILVRQTLVMRALRCAIPITSFDASRLFACANKCSSFNRLHCGLLVLFLLTLMAAWAIRVVWISRSTNRRGLLSIRKVDVDPSVATRMQKLDGAAPKRHAKTNNRRDTFLIKVSILVAIMGRHLEIHVTDVDIRFIRVHPH